MPSLASISRVFPRSSPNRAKNRTVIFMGITKSLYIFLHKLRNLDPFQPDLLNPALHPVPEQEAAGEEITPAEEVLADLGHLYHADKSRGYTGNGKDLGWRGAGDDTAEAGGFSREDRGRLAEEAADPSVKEGDPSLQGCAVQEIPGREIIKGIDDAVSIPCQGGDRVLIDGCINCSHRDVGIELLQPFSCDRCFSPPNVLIAVEDLAVQVRLVYPVIVRDDEGADPEDGKVHRNRRSKPSSPGNEYRCILQMLLPLLAKEHHLPEIAFMLTDGEQGYLLLASTLIPCRQRSGIRFCRSVASSWSSVGYAPEFFVMA